MRFFPGCSGCCSDAWLAAATKVLLWDTNCDAAMGGLSSLHSVFTTLGITSHTSSTWSGMLSDYRLIVFLMATSNPPWWAEITGATWSGRIHLSAEYNGFTTTRTYVNGLSGTTGMTVGNDTSGNHPCQGESGAPSAHQLTTGVAALYHADTASVSGGTTLFTNPSLALPMMQQNKPSGIDWVLSGDSSHLADHCPDSAAANKQFVCNLWGKPI